MADETLPDEMIIPLARGKILLMMAGSISFVALGLWMLSLGDDVGPRYDPAFVHLVAIVAIGFFGLMGLLWAKKLFESRPGLQFTRDGIIDNSSGVSAGLIAWSDITGFDVFKVRRTRSLIVKLADPQKYLAPGGVRRWVGEANMKLCGSPIGMTSNSLAISFDRLLELCRAYLARYGKPAS